MTTRVASSGTAHSPMSPEVTASVVRRVLASRGATVDTVDGTVTASGGSRRRYRAMGSTHPSAVSFMPWLCEVQLTPGEPTGCHVTVTVTSDQGWYLYQGAPTRRKWEILLGSVRDDVWAAVLPAAR